MADQAFEEAAAHAKTFKSASNTQLLELYKYYKQATSGDVTGKRPGMFSQKERAKFDAWTSVKGLDTATAKKKYVETVSIIDPSWKPISQPTGPASPIREELMKCHLERFEARLVKEGLADAMAIYQAHRDKLTQVGMSDHEAEILRSKCEVTLQQRERRKLEPEKEEEKKRKGNLCDCGDGDGCSVQ
uniref:ACB domain-containing protein n=1 Tax=Chromera velia CCMP2878 TaxID=1169474 RepID=A0A0G4FAY8_9ALVE|mmetsp:Transcript_47009/g.92807  ORF Transcript_47009/g.92807 Transcript_47009/m.92807 type:complete len:188 (+) Transcript_47009:108-671(+)|eukprot:Cvel_3011.t1-p1 / transcript=Cvel_3011.t1 / gene=Cvel_3011 / organism=Chromera_velia_CCMP2878 / gene_product=Acyl-CoA-binding protein, putative / transcript_product=Acyl-CoA-binding protein, putative / location=Cvel_scaffold120:23673-27914(-) / protein_length=187 / sequence_SO=supercontig / SO=protein_coding / is_pseudo=false